MKNKRWFLASCIFLLSFSSLVFAGESKDDPLLIKEAYLQYQMWALSRNYAFGTTLARDPIKALAWQIVYVKSLSKSYPGKSKLLKPYKRGLSKTQIKEAYTLADHYRKKYLLDYEMNEGQLSRLFVINENIKEKPLSGKKQYTAGSQLTRFQSMINFLIENKQTKLANLLEQRFEALAEEQEYPVVFGQVSVEGPEPAQMVDAPFKLFAQGFFVAYAKSSRLDFNLPGYEPFNVKISNQQQVQNLGVITLKPSPHKAKTGFVGRVLPWRGVDRGNIILRQATHKPTDEDNAWYQPVIPITILNSGKFYATGLTPGTYQLILQVNGNKVSKKFSLHKGHIKGLALVDLR